MQPAGICPTCHDCLPGWWTIAEPNKPARREYNHCKNPEGDREFCLCWKPNLKGYRR